jgi:hypothetical protein
MKGATAADWLLMAEFESLREKAYQYNHQERTATKPIKRNPLAHNLDFNPLPQKKHIFFNTARPKLKDLAEDLRLAETKLKWKWFFQNEPKNGQHMRIKYAKPASANFVTDPGLQYWISESRRRIINAAKGAIKRAKYKKQTNMLPITKWGIKLLHGEWRAVPTDKDGGFVLKIPTR